MKCKWKKNLIWVIFAALTLSMIACSKEAPEQNKAPQQNPVEAAEKTVIRVAALKGPTGMGMVELMEKNASGNADLDYKFTVMESPDELVGKIINGEVDVAAVPTNLALVLYNRTQGAVQLAAVNTLGVLYLLENGNNIQAITDLKEKKVSISGKGATPDFIFQYIIKENGLIPDKDVILDFKLQHADLTAALTAGDIKIALLPQPFVTTALMKNEDLRIALDITEEWQKVMNNESKLAMGCIVVQKKFAENNPAAMNAFLEEYKESIDFVAQQTDQAAALMEKYAILPNAAIAKKAIPYSNIVYIDAQEAKPFLEDFYQVLFDFEPKSVGGKKADEGFYYQK
jgi:NitT/TauT family transport system substrate-binding protein